MRNLSRISNYHNRQEAQLDCLAARFLARMRGVEPEPVDLSAGHRKLDRYTARLLERLGLDWEAVRELREMGSNTWGR